LSSKPNLLLLTTGGTIATTETEYGPVNEYDPQELLNKVPEVNEFCNITGESVISVDSVNIGYSHWVKLAEKIYEKYDEYDGFVITHGTDTMAYTSAALSYMLQDLGKTVVLTGGQRSIEEKGGDSNRNFIDAVRFACEDVSGVYIVFSGKVMFGTRAVKVRTKSYEGFESINCPYIAQVMGNWVKYTGEVRVPNIPDAHPTLNTNFCTDVLLVKLTPNIKSSFFEKVAKDYKGLIIEGYGNGGIPFEYNDLFSQIKKLSENGLFVVNTTQCLEEGTNLGRYAVRNEIKNSNIIDGKDMNTEAIVTKLMWVLGQTEQQDEAKKLMYKPINNDVSKDWYFG